MAHYVEFSIPQRALGKSDVTFSVRQGGSKVGTLKVSKGSVVWVPGDHSYGHRLSWRDFGALMQEHGLRIREG